MDENCYFFLSSPLNTVAFVVMNGISLNNGAGESMNMYAISSVVADDVVANDGIGCLINDFYASVPAQLVSIGYRRRVMLCEVAEDRTCFCRIDYSQ